MRTKWMAITMAALATASAQAASEKSDRICGFPGEAGHNIEQRIADCKVAYPSDSTRKSDTSNATISLVTRLISNSGKSEDVWKEMPSGLLWSDIIKRVTDPPSDKAPDSSEKPKTTYSWNELIEWAKLKTEPGSLEFLDDVETYRWVERKYSGGKSVKFDDPAGKTVCQLATEKLAAMGGLKDVHWHLPTADELAHIGRVDQSRYNEYEKKNITGNGLFAKLPNMADHWFWSSSPAGGVNAWGLSGSFGDVVSDDRDYDGAVRCLGR